MKKQFLFLTEVITVLNEKGEERLNKNSNPKKLTDDHGHSAEWYEDMNLPVPPELLNNNTDVDDDGYMSLNDDEIEYEYLDTILDYSDFMKATNHTEGFGSLVTLKNMLTFRVDEDRDEIYGQILYNERGWFERLRDDVRSWYYNFRQKRNKTEEN